VSQRAAQDSLRVRDLSVSFVTREDTVRAVEGVSFDLEPGEVVGLVGESGCGKSVTSLSILGLHEKAAGRVSGSSARRSFWACRTSSYATCAAIASA
jgi:peptide/nickel transport system ATP-binding protein